MFYKCNLLLYILYILILFTFLQSSTDCCNYYLIILVQYHPYWSLYEWVCLAIVWPFLYDLLISNLKLHFVQPLTFSFLHFNAGVATAFAAKDILGNVLSGLSMQFSKPFSLGDTIKVCHTSTCSQEPDYLILYIFCDGSSDWKCRKYHNFLINLP